MYANKSDVRSLSPRVAMAQAGRMDACCSAQHNIQYTDVVVIGNGPSGISLSFLLSGHWPYYTGVQHPDEYLQQRLMNEGSTTSIIEQDLEYLSSGLEVRSSNPVALLFDALTHPDADMGQDSPSLLEWRMHKEKAIPHVVLGKKMPGGAWQMMEGKMQTLSLGNWMQLPNFPFKEWLAKHRKTQKSQAKVQSNRASMEDVRQYYMEYVEAMNISQYFRNYCTVTSVQKVLDVCHSVDDESGEQVPCSRDHSGKIKWEVCGYESDFSNGADSPEIIEFCYRAPSVVLATGTFDSPNRLHIPGEHFSYVHHSYTELELDIESGTLTSDSDPLVVIGAGLSAADAILMALNNKIPVVHLFRRDPYDSNIVLKKLPEAVYPEYKQIYRMMCGEIQVDGYQAYAMHSVSEFLADGQIVIRANTKASCDIIIKTSQVLVLIGSQPDLSFLSKNGTNLGVVPDLIIDSKNNPLSVDFLTYQSVHECGLYAMGPLAGDNFVRFLRGGALGIVSDLWRKKEGKL